MPDDSHCAFPIIVHIYLVFLLIVPANVNPDKKKKENAARASCSQATHTDAQPQAIRTPTSPYSCEANLCRRMYVTEHVTADSRVRKPTQGCTTQTDTQKQSPHHGRALQGPHIVCQKAKEPEGRAKTKILPSRPAQGLVSHWTRLLILPLQSASSQADQNPNAPPERRVEGAPPNMALVFLLACLYTKTKGEPSKTHTHTKRKDRSREGMQVSTNVKHQRACISEPEVTIWCICPFQILACFFATRGTLHPKNWRNWLFRPEKGTLNKS